uniref:Flap endonuclease GEN homolog 1 n=1 Tax=Cavia porcellus TaxID=10141 RepID=A0A286XDK4_CAVPO|nr:flap endonuclease GEN homolog 1 [Cavia porcellus]
MFQVKQIISRMGVNDLWQILEPAKQHIHLQNLSGKTIAVDLSLWVCEAQSVRKMMGTVRKPHLRNLFFRISYLMQMDIKLVFVMEGEPPKLKADVMNKRNQIRYGLSGKTWSQKSGRSHFKSVLRECLEMLESLGIPWVQAAGEAEAMCAHLDAGGQVDGCLTNDGDAFLYGAQTVYRNFTMNPKDPHVDCYTASSIKNKLGLDRDALVALAVLLGCDYLPKGVPGVGREQALKLIQSLKGESLLQRFDQWNEISRHSSLQQQVAKKPAHCSVCAHPGSPKDHERHGCWLCRSDRYCEPHDYEYRCPCEWHQKEPPNGVESSVMRKACSCEGFPFHEVIQEFLLNKDKLVGVIRYQRPDLLLFQRFALEKMEWPNPYACEKLLVLLSHYDMIERKLGRRNSKQLQPVRIVKPRIRNGVHCFEIEWEMPEHFAVEHGELIVTVEVESLFEAAYPEIVAIYRKEKLETKGKKPKNMKIKPNKGSFPKSHDAVTLQSLVTVKLTPEIFPAQNTGLSFEMSDPALPRENASASLTSLLLPEDAPCLNKHEKLMSSSRPLPNQQMKAALSHSLESESGEPNPLSHDLAVITDLYLSSIDWEGTSFSNYLASEGNAGSCDLQSELESELLVTPGDFEDNPKQLSCESGQYTTNINKALGGNLKKISPEEHLLSGIGDLCLQDLPLKERVYMKSSYREDNVQSNVDLKNVSLSKVKESGITNGRSDCPPHLSKSLPGIHVQNEPRNPKVIKEDQLSQGNCKVNTILFCVKNPVVETSGMRTGPQNTSLDRSSKAGVHTTQKLAESSICCSRHSPDQQLGPVSAEAKSIVHNSKHSSWKRDAAQFKKSDHQTQKNTAVCAEAKLGVRSHRTTGNEEKHFLDSAKSSLSFLQCDEKDDDPGACLNSPLPLCQRLKLRFQNIGNEI